MAKEMCGFERGEWSAFLWFSNAYHGKQYYFLQDDGTVYSRESGKYMSVHEAMIEFAKTLEGT